MGEMDTYREIFLAESADYLQQLTDGLLALEVRPTDSEALETVFRGAHSLKGMSAAMMYVRTAELTHKMEGLMAKVRKGDQVANRDLISLMLSAVDLAEELIADEAAGRSDVDPSKMIDALVAMRDMPPGESAAPIAPSSSVAAEEAADGGRWRITVTIDDGCVLKAVRAWMVLERLAKTGTIIATDPAIQDIEDERFGDSFEAVISTEATGDTLREVVLGVTEIDHCEVQLLEDAPDTPVEAAESGGVAGKSLHRVSATQTVRVSIAHLDELVNLAGQLVILRSRLDSVVNTDRSPELSEHLDEMRRIAEELQYEVMQTRMVPVGNIFNRFPRMVRDLAVDLGKRVEFLMSGLDIELDRTVIDEIADPLVHLLRNSLDHGIEPADVRREAGKSEAGTIRLSASREQDHVRIIVSDDGRGIDPELIWRKACERGVVSHGRRSEYTEADILLLTCTPGFSTMDEATRVSGRGVGMDVVKDKIEQLGGRLQIASTLGAGTEFTLILPFTLAIVQALLVSSSEQTFAVPLSSVQEVFSASEMPTRMVDGRPVIILRTGEVVGLLYLDALLFGADPERLPDGDESIILMHDEESHRAVVVGRVVGRQEIVIKPLPSALMDSHGFSGTTVLGDGRAVLILDARSLFSMRG